MESSDTSPVGLPSEPLHTGEKKTESMRITVIDYDETHLQEKEVQAVEECFPFKEKPTVTWINIDGLHDNELIKKVGNSFNIHHLTLEDIVTTGQRPKMEDFTDYIFLILKMVEYDEKEKKIKTEQISIVLGSNYVISFQEDVGDVFDTVRQRIRSEKSYVRKMGADYLMYALLDAIVDNYFVILESLGEYIEDREEELVKNPTVLTFQTIQALKREMIELRRSIWPLREILSNLRPGESSLIEKKTAAYLRDVYDHTFEVMDTVETYRDILSEMIDIYLSTISNRTNEIMKVLTIIATIFIPLTFIVGLYGMNFRYMPELESKWGYPSILGVMIAASILMLSYFRKKKWL